MGSPSGSVPVVQQSSPQVPAVVEAHSVAAALVAQESALAVRSGDEYEAAGRLLVALTTAFKIIEAERFELTKPLDALKEKWIAIFQLPLDRLSAAVTSLKRKRVAWQAEAERQRKAEEERARQEALKAQARLDAAADKKAERLLEKGHVEEAERILDAVPQVQMPVVAQTEAPKTAGVAGRKNWKFRIVSEEEIPREYLVPDLVKIGGVVRAMKDKTSISGIEVYSEDTESVRAER